jgi:SAM-dependent methyltransferase
VLDLAEQVGDDLFVATPSGNRLRSDAPNSLRGMAMLWGDRIWRSLETIGETLRTGEPGWGNGNFGAIHSDPAASDTFNRAMAEPSVPIGRALAGACDFSRFTNVADIGGGYGAILIEVLRANPHLTGFVQDLELIADGAARYLAEAGLGDRASFRGGDFFAQVSGDADCILLKYILHDWPDDDCARILANCRTALAPGAGFILLERILPKRVGPQDEPVVRTDLVMMPISGKERTEAEFRAMLGTAGFAVDAVKPLADGCWAMETHAV